MILAATCSQLVEQFDAQGAHRTGTDTDYASARWLVEAFRARGVEAQLDTYPFTRVDPGPCSVSGPDWEIAGEPFSDSLLPAPGKTLSGRIASAPGPGTFALVRADPHGVASPIDPLREEAWTAVIAAMEGPGLTLRNQWRYGEPFGPPVIQVPASAAGQLEGARDASTPLTVRCGARRSRVGASNVRARVAGRHPELAPVVVLTPRSGWWNCAGERGGGIAALLEVAGEVRRLGLSRNVDFVASTGHELGFWGIRQHVERFPQAARESHYWIHLGANIGASGTTPAVRSSTARLLEMAQASGHIVEGPARWELCERAPGGEAQVVEAAGGAYISIVGAGFDLFHSTEDRWPSAIDAAAIARNAAFVLELLLQSEPGYRI